MTPNPFAACDANRAEANRQFAEAVRGMSDRELHAFATQAARRAKRTGWVDAERVSGVYQAEIKRREDEQSGQAA